MINLLTLPFEPLRSMIALCCGKRPEKKNREDAVICIQTEEGDKLTLNPIIVKKFEEIANHFESRKKLKFPLHNIKPCGDVKTDKLITVMGSVKYWNYAQIQMNTKLAEEILQEGLKPLHYFLVGRELGKLHFDSHYSVTLEKSKRRNQLCLLGYVTTIILVFVSVAQCPYLYEQITKVKLMACHILSCISGRFLASFKADHNIMDENNIDFFAIVDQHREGNRLKIKVDVNVLKAAIDHLKAIQHNPLEPIPNARIEMLEYLLKHHKGFN